MLWGTSVVLFEVSKSFSPCNFQFLLIISQNSPNTNQINSHYINIFSNTTPSLIPDNVLTTISTDLGTAIIRAVTSNFRKAAENVHKSMEHEFTLPF